jgi:hypothetical protein
MPANRDNGPGERRQYYGSKRAPATPDADARDVTEGQRDTLESGLKGGAGPIPSETAGMIDGRTNKTLVKHRQGAHEGF